MEIMGELAALGTAAAFAVNSVLFTLAGKKVGAVIVNRIRLLFAVLLLITAHWGTTGTLLPVYASSRNWFWLSLSGLAGLVLGDIFLFNAFVVVGARISMLMMSLAPVIASLIAWIFLGEMLGWLQIGGIFAALAGVGWVIWEHNQQPEHRGSKYKQGVLLASGGAFGQAVGMVLAKVGLQDDLSPLSANLIRMLTAFLVLWGMTFFQGQIRATIQQVYARKKAALYIMGGAFVGPFLGVSLSLFSIQRTAVGISTTLMALSPVFLLPVGAFLFGERIGFKTILATILALAGVGILFLV
jgi:drug/metabolite transporter (DMT)-like permease